MAGKGVPLRRSLLIRLLATSVLIVGCAITATTWLAVKTTTRAIQQAQGQVLAGDAQIYDALMGWAATHDSWAGVEPLVTRLSGKTARQITLTTSDRTVIAGARTQPLPDGVSAVVDPLQTDPVLLKNAAGGIDPRALGQFRLSDADRRRLQAQTERVQRCMSDQGLITTTATDPAGRTSISVLPGDDHAADRLRGCERTYGPTDQRTPGEMKAIGQLNVLVSDCLRAGGLPSVQMTGASSWTPRQPLDLAQAHQVQDCVDVSRRKQLRPFVAPRALLFVRTPAGAPPSAFDLSSGNVIRIVGVAALVLALTVAATVLTGIRLIRPMRALTAATLGASRRVEVRGRDEIGVLAAAFNDLSDRRERAEDQRKAMVSDVAHELRTPLTNIRAWLEAIEDGLASPAADPMLTAALLREALQLQHLIDDLQDLAAADAGGFSLHTEPVALATLLDQVLIAHEGAAEAAGVTLRTRSATGLTLTADPVRLRQAVDNLVSNAVRHTPPGGAVTLQAGAADGHTVEIEVSDTGPGIAADQLAYVFDRFWRADVSRSRHTGGSGLGLAIVRQIASAHGGEVTAASAPGRGATFTLRLPLSS